MSPTAALKRALTREDADRIARKLVSAAKAGDLAAVKLIFDRVDYPQNGPLAVALAQASAAQASPEAGNVQIVIADNGRENYLKRASDAELLKIVGKAPFDYDGFKSLSRTLFGMPTGDSPPAPAPPTEPTDGSEPVEGEPVEPAGVVSGEEFLES